MVHSSAKPFLRAAHDNVPEFVYRLPTLWTGCRSYRACSRLDEEEAHEIHLITQHIICINNNLLKSKTDEAHVAREVAVSNKPPTHSKLIRNTTAHHVINNDTQTHPAASSLWKPLLHRTPPPRSSPTKRPTFPLNIPHC